MSLGICLALLAGIHIQSAENAYKSGMSAAAKGEAQDAERSFLKAIDIEPTYMDAYRAMVSLYTHLDRARDASAMLARILQIEPESFAERIQLGNLLLEARQWSRALAQFSYALQRSPRNPAALYGFALTAFKNDLTPQALEAATRGAALFPGDRRFAQLLKEQPQSAGEGNAPGNSKQ